MKIKYFLLLWLLNYSFTSAQVELPISEKIDNAVKIVALDDSALVYYDGKGLGLMSLFGERLSSANYFSIVPLGRSRYSVQNKENGRTALMNQNGKLITPFDYKDISDFTSNITRVSKFSNNAVDSEYALMDLDGLIISDWLDSIAIPSDESICMMRNKEDWIRFKNGKYEPFLLDFEDVGKFSDGFAPAKMDSLWGYIDEEGQWLIDPQYKKANSFLGRYAAVSTNGVHWEFIDRKGDFVIDEIFDTIIQYQEGTYSIVSKNQQWKYLNPLLKNINNDWFKIAQPFSKEGIARVMKDSSQYYMNLFGEYIFKSDELLDFKNGVGVFRKGDVWGFINENGDEMVSPEFTKVLAHEGDNLIVTKDSMILLVTNTGEVIQEILSDEDDVILTPFVLINGIKASYFLVDIIKSSYKNLFYDEVGDISNGFIVVKKGSLFGYIDINGKEVFPPINSNATLATHENLIFQKTPSENFISYDFSKNIQFSLVEGIKFLGPYSESKAKVIDKKGRMGFIDEKGQVVVECQYLLVGDYKNGRSIYKKYNGLYGYLNENGEEIIPAIYQWVSNFDKSGYAVAVKDKMFGFINSMGNVVIPFQYENVFSLKEGISSVQKDGKVGYINMQNKKLVPFSFDEAYESVNDLALVRMGTYWGYVNPKGKVIIPWQFEAAQAFTEGKAWVKLSAKYGLIDEKGRYLLPFKYENAFPFQQGFAKVQLNGKWGLVNEYGVEVIPPVCEQIGSIYNNKVIVQTTSEGYGITLLK